MKDVPTIPERLWKYRPWNDFTHNLIVKGELFFANTQQLNDPFEVSWYLRLPSDANELDAFSRELCADHFPNDSIAERKRHFANMKQSVADLIKQHEGYVVPAFVNYELGIFCMSEVNNNVLMWSHYANDHHGVCVGITPKHIVGKRILKVLYEDRIPLLDCWAYVNRRYDMFVDASRTKGKFWDYEKEWRSIHYTGAHCFEHCVDSVVIGLRATAETRAAVRAAAKQAPQPVVIFEARIRRGYYGLDVVRVEA